MNEVGLPWPPLECTLSLASCRLRAESLARRLHCRFWAPTGSGFQAGFQAASAATDSTDTGNGAKPNAVKGYSIHGLVNGHWCSPPHKNVYWDQAYDPLDGSDSEEIEDEVVVKPPGRLGKDAHSILRPPGEHRILGEGMGSVLLHKKAVHFPGDLRGEQEKEKLAADSDVSSDSERTEEDPCSGRLYRGYSYEQGLDKIGLTNGDEAFERKFQETDSDSDDDEFVSARELIVNEREVAQVDHVSNGLKLINGGTGRNSSNRLLLNNGVIVEEDEDDNASEISISDPFQISSADTNKDSDNDTGIGSNLTNGKHFTEVNTMGISCSDDTSASITEDVTLMLDGEITKIAKTSNTSEDEGVESEKETVNCEDGGAINRNRYYQEGKLTKGYSSDSESVTENDSTGDEIADFDRDAIKKCDVYHDSSESDDECVNFAFQSGEVASGTQSYSNYTRTNSEKYTPDKSVSSCDREKLGANSSFTKHWTRPVVFGKKFGKEDTESDSGNDEDIHSRKLFNYNNSDSERDAKNYAIALDKNEYYKKNTTLPAKQDLYSTDDNITEEKNVSKIGTRELDYEINTKSDSENSEDENEEQNKNKGDICQSFTAPVVFGPKANHDLEIGTEFDSNEHENDSENSEEENEEQNKTKGDICQSCTAPVAFGSKVNNDLEGGAEIDSNEDESDGENSENENEEQNKNKGGICQSFTAPVIFGPKVNHDLEDVAENDSNEDENDSENSEDENEEENKSKATVAPVVFGPTVNHDPEDGAEIDSNEDESDSENSENENEEENKNKSGICQSFTAPVIFGPKVNHDLEDVAEIDSNEDENCSENSDNDEILQDTFAASVVFGPKVNYGFQDDSDNENLETHSAITVGKITDSSLYESTKSSSSEDESEEEATNNNEKGESKLFSQPVVFGSKFNVESEEENDNEDEVSENTLKPAKFGTKFNFGCEEKGVEVEENNVEKIVELIILGDEKKEKEQQDDDEEYKKERNDKKPTDDNSFEIKETKNVDEPVLFGPKLYQELEDDEENDEQKNDEEGSDAEEVIEDICYTKVTVGAIDKFSEPALFGPKICQDYDEHDSDNENTAGCSEGTLHEDQNICDDKINIKSPIVLGRRLSQHFDDEEQDDWRKELLKNISYVDCYPTDENDQHNEKPEKDDIDNNYQPLSETVVFGAKFFHELEDDDNGIDFSSLHLQDLDEEDDENETSSSIFYPLKYVKPLDDTIDDNISEDGDTPNDEPVPSGVSSSGRFKFQVTPVSEQDHLDSLQSDCSDWLLRTDNFSRCSSLSDRDRTEFDDDEEDRYRPILWRSTSLKTGKTPPGTPRRKKIVRFADALGLDLEAVRHIVSDDIPTVPASAFMDLKLEPPTPSPSITAPVLFSARKCLCPQFSQPGSEACFLSRVKTQKVCLENVVVASMDVLGVVRVLNCSFHKSVTVRYTADEWRSHQDLSASYVQGSSDGFSDRFKFTLHLPGLRAGDRIVFAIRYSAGDLDYWDNNHGVDYVLRCMTVSQLNDDSDPRDEGLFSFV